MIAWSLVALCISHRKFCCEKQSSKGNTSAENKCNQNEDGGPTSTLLDSQKLYMVGSVVTVVNTLDQQAIMGNKEFCLHLTTILADLTKEKARLMWLIQIVRLLWITIKNYNLQICTHDWASVLTLKWILVYVHLETSHNLFLYVGSSDDS